MDGLGVAAQRIDFLAQGMYLVLDFFKSEISKTVVQVVFLWLCLSMTKYIKVFGEALFSIGGI